MMRLFLLTSLLSLFLAPAAAQEIAYSALLIPAELKEGAKSVVRAYDEKLTVHSDRESTLNVRKVITVLHQDHDDEAEFTVHYSKGTSRVTRFDAVVYGPMGQKLDKIKNSAIQDYSAVDGFAGDGRVKYAEFKPTSYPYTVVFEYEVKSNDISMIAGLPSFAPQGYDQGVEKANFTVSIPADNGLRYLSHDIGEPKQSTREGKTYTWEVSNLAPRSYEGDGPAYFEVMPNVQIGLDKFKVDGYEGSLTTWNDFGKFMGQLLEGRDVLTEELAALVQEKTAGLTSDRDKIDALYRLMQERTRYISVQLGIGGWQPFPVEYVEANKYGDCKALSNYMGAMLKEVGIESYPVLVESSNRESLPKKETFTSTRFNHMILYVPKEDMYLECTSSLYPTGYTGGDTEGRNVLLITPEGGRLAQTPRSTAADNGRIKTTTINLLADGSAELTFSQRYFGATHDRYRWLRFFDPTAKEQIKELHRWDDIPDVHGDGFSLTVLRDEPEAHLTYATTMQGFASSMGKRTFLPINKYSTVAVPDKLEKRRTPIVGSSARFYVDTIKIDLLPEVEIESLGPERIDLDHAVGAYRSSISVTGNHLEWVRTLKIVPFELPAAEYDGYRNFFLEVAKADGRKVVLKERKTK